MSTAEQHGLEPRGPLFTTTHWSVVVSAGQEDEAIRSRALETLCATYWVPVYAYIRRRGNGPEDAKDLTQEFFARLLAKEWLAGLEPRASRFRAFLLTAVSRFLANAHDHRTALKRGGGQTPVELDEAEIHYGPTWSTASPEQAYDHGWAITVLKQSIQHLTQESTANGTSHQFRLLSPFLSREAGVGEYESLAHTLKTTPGAIGVSVLRLRRRYREIVRRVVAETLGTHGDLEDEVRHLVQILRNS